jgi:hypothetical protein
VRRATRYRRTDAGPQPAAGTLATARGPKYLVVYELDDLAVLDGDWAALMDQHSETSRQMYGAMRNTVRETYELIAERDGSA